MVKMDLCGILLELAAIHDRETAKSKSGALVDEFLNSLTDEDIADRWKFIVDRIAP